MAARTGFIDRAIRAVAPRAYAARQDARRTAELADAREARHQLMLEQEQRAAEQRAAEQRTLENIDRIATRAYDAAVYNPAVPYSAYSNAGPNETILGALGTVRALVRDSIRNDEIALEAVDAAVDLIHGGGIHPRAACERFSSERNDEINTRVMARYFEYYESLDIDVYAQNDFVGLIDLGLRGERGADGEFILLKRWHRRSVVEAAGMPHPMKLELVEPQWLADRVQSFTYRNKEYPVVGGVVVDPDTKGVVGYLMYTGVSAGGVPGGEYKFVDARLVIHYFDVKRPGQRRGISPLASSLYTFRDLRNLAAAGLDQQIVGTAMMLVLGVRDDKGPDASRMGEYNPGGAGMEAGSQRPGDTLPNDARLRDARGAVIEQVRSGQVARVAKGTEVNTITPPRVDGLMDIYKLGMRRIATAAGVSYPQLSKDYGDGNFVSLRMESAPIMRRARKRRWNLIVRVHQQVFRDWVTGCYTMAQWNLPGRERYFTPDEFRWTDVEWIEPPEDSADPKGDAEARRIDMENGIIDQSDIWRSRGLDPRQQWRARGINRQMAADNGLDADRYTWARNNSNPTPATTPAADDAQGDNTNA